MQDSTGQSPSSAPSATQLLAASQRTGRKYTAFGVSIISDRKPAGLFTTTFVAFGKQGHFAKPLQTGTRIKLVVQAQSQPDNIASIPLLTATFVRPVRPVAQKTTTEQWRREPL